ncbi:DsrE family protein [Thalassoroseus pseudoceratinae]|uniref:DsrE family protein n=1 Tax=Thalassoroseus pseudoceratinae TaxID=2713176 RepID=UPI001F0ED785|nr:DsrE family protein [Thalassoroseus pseudoceratinae]
MRIYLRLAALVMIAGLLCYGVVTKSVASSKPQDNQTTEPHYIHPAIQGFGKVVQLPNAVHQPRSGSKIVVDITKGSDPSKLNSAIEKVCRFVNIYAGAGRTPVKVDIAVVLHGDATLAILNNNAYSARFKTDGNPNLACLRELNNAGVKVSVCGQSLTAKDARPEEVSKSAQVAVSALTALVNLQADGYAYLPMLK